MQCNLTTKNPRLREFFNKREVRQAFMYAVDRDEMNELVFDGLAKPRQYSPLEQSPQYYETLSTSHILYDPDLANQLLDEAGYAERGADGYRVWPDGSGEPISFMIEGTAAAGTPDEDAVNMLGTYHDAIGIKTNYRYSERSLYTEHFEANEIEAPSGATVRCSHRGALYLCGRECRPAVGLRLGALPQLERHEPER